MHRKNPPDQRDQRQIAELVLQLGRAAYADCMAGGPTQAQWQALRFFARANRFSRNVSGFAEFHATTRGTASQTVKGLVGQGYLTRVRSAKDGRSARFDLTDSARELLQKDPLETLVRAAGNLSPAQRTQTVNCLKQIMMMLARERARSLTGVCEVCGHLESGDGQTFQCGLMHESLSVNELQEICVRFQPPG